MDERTACALLKQRFEAAGFHIEENQPFDEQGVRFEIDGWSAEARVGYEYISSEAGDGWDVDASVVAALEARRKKGELHVLFVDERDAARIGELADAFLAALKPEKVAKAKKAVATPKKVAATPKKAAAVATKPKKKTAKKA